MAKKLLEYKNHHIFKSGNGVVICDGTFDLEQFHIRASNLYEAVCIIDDMGAKKTYTGECQCGEDVKVQNYKNEVVVSYPFAENKTVCIDACILKEILLLWSLGIETTGCCCGHNELLPFIGVKDEYIDQMIELGYIVQINNSGIDNLHRLDSFYPKSIKTTIGAYIRHIEHLETHTITKKQINKDKLINSLITKFHKLGYCPSEHFFAEVENCKETTCEKCWRQGVTEFVEGMED